MADPDNDSTGSRWSTASFGQPADTSPIELAALGEHLDLCRSGSRVSTLRYVGQLLRGFVTAHLVTSAVVVAGVGAVVWLAVTL